MQKINTILYESGLLIWKIREHPWGILDAKTSSQVLELFGNISVFMWNK